MKTLRVDLVLLAGAIVLASVGLFTGGQAAFSETYTRDQLLAEKITFTAADKLTAEEKSWKPGSTCLVEYSGQPLTTGKQAECYANYYIRLHLTKAVDGIGYPGETYGSIGNVQSTLKVALADAKATQDTATAAAVQKKLDAVNNTRETLFKGEMLRSALLTVYGFSILGSLAGTVATLSYAAASLLVVLAGVAFLRGRGPAIVPQRRRSGATVAR